MLFFLTWNASLELIRLRFMQTEQPPMCTNLTYRARRNLSDTRRVALAGEAFSRKPDLPHPAGIPLIGTGWERPAENFERSTHVASRCMRPE